MLIMALFSNWLTEFLDIYQLFSWLLQAGTSPLYHIPASPKGLVKVCAADPSWFLKNVFMSSFYFFCVCVVCLYMSAHACVCV